MKNKAFKILFYQLIYVFLQTELFDRRKYTAHRRTYDRCQVITSLLAKSAQVAYF